MLIFIQQVKLHGDAERGKHMQEQIGEAVCWELVRILRRIENGIELQENIHRLWRLCEREQINFEYLQSFMQQALFNYERTLQRIASSLQPPEETALNPEKIAFILCVNDETDFEEVVLYLQHLYVPSGMDAEIIPIRGAASMCAGYEEGRKASNAKYKVYLHQDVQVIRKNLIDELLMLFRNPQIGLIGLAGCEKLPENAIWWYGEGIHNIVAHDLSPERLNVFGSGVPCCQVQAADGVLLATQYDIPWRQDLFQGWHFYDISICQEYRRLGYQVVLPRQEEPWIIHQTRHTKVGEDYYVQQRIFLQHYYPFS